jgi:single-stranded-DNA-specific exonuclease
MLKQLIIKPRGDENSIKHLSDVLGVNDHLANLLVHRGISTFDEAEYFFRPSLENLHDPFLMTDMNKAVERLDAAIIRSENILIYGDYDVDGTTSVAMVYSFLKKYTDSIGFYIPDRYTEGYGISKKGIDYAADHNYTLIVALDCGIKAEEKINYANQKKIDFIICDHHTPGEKIPNAFAVLDPKRPDCNYPDKNLSGCGVGFKLLQAFASRKKIPFEALTEYIDLTAVSIASDIVPVIGENRILAFHGLKKLGENPVRGLKTIKQVAGIKEKEITISDCVFKIGPRINAAGRIKSGSDAVKLLISDEAESAKGFALQIDGYNDERKSLDRMITHEALREIGNSIEKRNRKTTVLFNKEWHKGVIGIVASRLTDTYYRPTVILTESNGFATGSARSISDFNLYDAVEACSHLLENFGGHKFAAGLTMKLENVEEFSDCFERYVSEHITEDQLRPVIEVDDEIKLSDIDRKFYNIIRQMAPFGPENMNPVFLTRNVYDTGNSKVVGNNKEHLRLEIRDDVGNVLNGIAFSPEPEHVKHIIEKKPFSVCYSIDRNDFNGASTLQLKIKEIIIETIS